MPQFWIQISSFFELIIFSWLDSLTAVNTYSQNIHWRHFGAFSVSHSAPRRSTCLGLFSLDRTRHVANFNQGLSLDLKNRFLVLFLEFIVPPLRSCIQARVGLLGRFNLWREEQLCGKIRWNARSPIHSTWLKYLLRLIFFKSWKWRFFETKQTLAKFGVNFFSPDSYCLENLLISAHNDVIELHTKDLSGWQWQLNGGCRLVDSCYGQFFKQP